MLSVVQHYEVVMAHFQPKKVWIRKYIFHLPSSQKETTSNWHIPKENFGRKKPNHKFGDFLPKQCRLANERHQIWNQRVSLVKKAIMILPKMKLSTWNKEKFTTKERLEDPLQQPCHTQDNIRLSLQLTGLLMIMKWHQATITTAKLFSTVNQMIPVPENLQLRTDTITELTATIATATTAALFLLTVVAELLLNLMNITLPYFLNKFWIYKFWEFIEWNVLAFLFPTICVQL